jgi:Recombination endonuclease VII
MTCPSKKSGSTTWHCDKDREAQRSYGPKFGCGPYWDLFDGQDGRCGVCKVRWREGRENLLAVDHCHRTGLIRGLTHARCQRDITVEVVDAILTSEDDVVRHRGEIIPREVVRYIRNPPGARLGIHVPPEHMRRLEEKAAQHRQKRADRKQTRGGRSAGGRAGKASSWDRETSPTVRALSRPANRSRWSNPSAEAWALRAERDEGDRLRRAWAAFTARERERAAQEQARREARLVAVATALRVCAVLCAVGLTVVIIVTLLPALVVLAAAGAAALLSGR